MKSNRFAVLLVIALLAIAVAGMPVPPASSAMSMVLPAGNSWIRVTVHSQNQGTFTFNAFSYSGTTNSSRDSGTGMGSGKRQHMEITVIKGEDAASKKLRYALQRREALPEVTLELVKTDTNGKEEVHHTIKLKSAIIAAIQEGGGPASSGDKKERGEQVSFSYEKIEFEHKSGKTTALDDWLQRR